MTLWGATPIIGSLIGVIVVFACYYSYVKAQSFRLARHEYWSDRFYSAAKPLVANPETPASIISLIEGLNDLMLKDMAPIGIYQVYQKKIEEGHQPASRTADEEFDSFFKKFPELVRKANVVSYAGMLAASYAGLAGGSYARAVLADVFAEMEMRHHEIGDAQDVRAANNAQRGTSLVPLIMRR